jgi:DNA-binding NtrC family response regulator
VEAIKAGAHDYITKPFDHEELKRIISKALKVEEADRRKLNEPLRNEIVGQNVAMRAIFELVDRVAPSPSTVLILGESGTGKELVARALHERSDRAGRPFLQVNCGAIPEALFESELFGHEKGAFTGAVGARQGRFELADRGTLFLDEVGELPLAMQVKLLRVLQERCFERVGGVRNISVDVRLIAATNRDLAVEVRAGRFREDLYYRLNVIPIRLPPLRERAEDIPLLANHFLARFAARLGRAPRELSAEAVGAMMTWAWPGNIREVENLMERASLLGQGAQLGLAELQGLAGLSSEPLQGLEPEPEEIEERGGLKEIVRVYTAQLERSYIQRVLNEEAGNVTRAARKLGISRKGLQLKMKEYGLREPADGG